MAVTQSMGTILVVYLFRVTLVAENSSAKAQRPDKLIFIAKIS